MIVIAAAVIILFLAAIGMAASLRRRRTIDLSGSERANLAYQRLMHMQPDGLLDMTAPPADHTSGQVHHDYVGQPPHPTHDHTLHTPQVDPGMFHSHPQPDTSFQSPPDSSSGHGHHGHSH